MKKCCVLITFFVIIFSTVVYADEWGRPDDHNRNRTDWGSQAPYYPDQGGWPYQYPHGDYRIPADKENYGHFSPGQTERYNPYTHKWERNDGWR